LVQAEPNLRLKGRSFMEKYSNSVIECVNGYLKLTKVT